MAMKQLLASHGQPTNNFEHRNRIHRIILGRNMVDSEIVYFLNEVESHNLATQLNFPH